MTAAVSVRSFHISLFNNIEDNVVKTRDYTLHDFINFLIADPKLVKGVVGPEDKASKNKGQMWSPCRYAGPTRSKHVPVTVVSCLSLDFDKGSDAQPGLTAADEDALFAWLEHKKYRYAGHTTFTAGYFAPRRKLRIVLFFDKDATPADSEAIWDEITAQLPVRPDRSRRSHRGNYFSPRCPAEHASLYESFTDGHKLLSSVPAAPKVASLDYSSAKAPGTFDQIERVRLATEKEPELSAACFNIGQDGRRLGKSLESIQQEYIPKFEQALRENVASPPVEDWSLARSTIIESLEEGYNAEVQEQKKIQEVVEGFAPTERQIAKAEKALRDAVKTFHKDVTKLYQRSFIVGRYVPHVIPLERAQAELWAAYLKEGNKAGERDAAGKFLGGVEAQKDIISGLARGQKQPMFIASEDWEKSLLRDEMGPQCCEENVKLILQKHPKIEGLRWNVRQGVATVDQPPPWELNSTDYPVRLGEDDAYAVGSWLGTQMGNRPLKNVKKVYAALKAAAKVHEYDPFLEYLESLKWDGRARLDRWLVDNARAEDTEYVRLVSGKFLLQAVARTYEPGCKVDHVLVLIGTEQGEGKSTVFETLAGREYFCADVGDIKEKESSILLQKYVIVEMPELAGLNKRDSEEVKRYVSNNSEDFRAAYRADAEQIIRRAVFGGTTNVRECLRDETGGRRFWPVEVGQLDTDQIALDRDQLWAEAVHRYKAGEQWWPKRGKETELCQAAQEEHLDKDDLAEDLEFFRRPVNAGLCAAKSINPSAGQVDPKTNLFRWVTVDQMYTCLGLDKKNRFDQLRVKSLGRLMKWKKTSVRTSEGVVKAFALV